jgi:hypothetical protein
MEGTLQDSLLTTQPRARSCKIIKTHQFTNVSGWLAIILLTYDWGNINLAQKVGMIRNCKRRYLKADGYVTDG